jgi:hypothetical protein
MYEYDRELIKREFERIRKNNPNVYTVKKKDLQEGKYIFIF